MQTTMLVLAVIVGVGVGVGANSPGLGVVIGGISAAPVVISMFVQRVASGIQRIPISVQRAAQLPKAIERQFCDGLLSGWSYLGVEPMAAKAGWGEGDIAHVWQFDGLISVLLKTKGAKLAVAVEWPTKTECVLGCWMAEWSLDRGGILVPGALAALRRKWAIELWARG